jgi:hypothetical protein
VHECGRDWGAWLAREIEEDPADLRGPDGQGRLRIERLDRGFQIRAGEAREDLRLIAWGGECFYRIELHDRGRRVGDG